MPDQVNISAHVADGRIEITGIYKPVFMFKFMRIPLTTFKVVSYFDFLLNLVIFSFEASINCDDKNHSTNLMNKHYMSHILPKKMVKSYNGRALWYKLRLVVR